MDTLTAPPVADDPLKRMPTAEERRRDPVGTLARMPTEDDLPYSDGVPMDSPWHRASVNLLIESVELHWAGRKDFYVGGDMFMYFSNEHVFNKDFRGPDFYAVVGADHDKPRKSWVSWQEGDRLPDLIIELASPTTQAVDRVVKKKLYDETFETAEYFIYDPDGHRIEGWERSAGRYTDPVPVDAAGRVWSRVLGLYLGPWDGVYQGHHNRWPRLFQPDGSIVFTFAEAAAAERTRAEAELARLRAELAAKTLPPTT